MRRRGSRGEQSPAGWQVVRTRGETLACVCTGCENKVEVRGREEEQVDQVDNVRGELVRFG